VMRFDENGSDFLCYYASKIFSVLFFAIFGFHIFLPFYEK